MSGKKDICQENFREIHLPDLSGKSLCNLFEKFYAIDEDTTFGLFPHEMLIFRLLTFTVVNFYFF